VPPDQHRRTACRDLVGQGGDFRGTGQSQSASPGAVRILMATLPVKQSREPMILNAAGLPIRMQDTAHFAASRSARELKSWNPITLSPDAELNTELSTLVERSRDISRNHGVASGAVQTLV